MNSCWKIRLISNCLLSSPFQISLGKRELVIFLPNIPPPTPQKKLPTKWHHLSHSNRNQKMLRVILVYLFLITLHTHSTCYSCQLCLQNTSQIWWLLLLLLSTSPALLKSIFTSCLYHCSSKSVGLPAPPPASLPSENYLFKSVYEVNLLSWLKSSIEYKNINLLVLPPNLSIIWRPLSLNIILLTTSIVYFILVTISSFLPFEHLEIISFEGNFLLLFLCLESLSHQ